MDFLVDKAGFKANVTVAQLTKGMQQAFAEWSAKEFDYSPSYIGRNLW
jgi:hypothetical protein